MNEIIESFFITVKLAFVTTFLLMFISIPLSYWLTISKSRLSGFVGTIISMPLVLPPSVIGFYLLLAYSPNGPIGYMTNLLGFESLAFTFAGLVIGSLIYSLPFVVTPLRNAFESLDLSIIHASYSLGASPITTFSKIVLPSIKSGIIAAAVLGFAHTVGEFGVVLMIGGGIPGVTKVMSVSIYESVETLNYDHAHILSLFLLLFSFIIMLPLNGVGVKKKLLE